MKNSRKILWFWFGMWGAVIPLAILGYITSKVAVVTVFAPIVIIILAAALFGHIGKN